MLIGEPLPSQYDWRFSIFGFPVRVTWLFWAVIAALGYNQAAALSRLSQHVDGPNSLGTILAIWIACAFVSILIHELGHAFAFRYFGVESEIVLYHMGGLAIPGAGFLWRRQGRTHRLTHRDQIIISAAGPVAQLILAAILMAIAIKFEIYVHEAQQFAKLVHIKIPVQEQSGNFLWMITFSFLFYINVWWALLNLIPIYPLDGGQIFQHAVGIFRRTDGRYEAHCVSVIVAFALAYWLYRSQGNPINALFVLSLGVSNLQALQSLNGPRIW